VILATDYKNKSLLITPGYGKGERVRKINVDEGLCTGCGICIEFCPKKVLSRSKDRSLRGFYPAWVEDLEACTLCGLCELYCPDFAIVVEGEKDE
jgi:2-oxoglutarate ferredoxin oxidoreductase subunit delta